MKKRKDSPRELGEWVEKKIDVLDLILIFLGTLCIVVALSIII